MYLLLIMNFSPWETHESTNTKSSDLCSLNTHRCLRIYITYILTNARFTVFYSHFICSFSIFVMRWIFFSNGFEPILKWNENLIGKTNERKVKKGKFRKKHKAKMLNTSNDRKSTEEHSSNKAKEEKTRRIYNDKI